MKKYMMFAWVGMISASALYSGSASAAGNCSIAIDRIDALKSAAEAAGEPAPDELAWLQAATLAVMECKAQAQRPVRSGGFPGVLTVIKSAQTECNRAARQMSFLYKADCYTRVAELSQMLMQ